MKPEPEGNWWFRERQRSFKNVKTGERSYIGGVGLRGAALGGSRGEENFNKEDFEGRS